MFKKIALLCLAALLLLPANGLAQSASVTVEDVRTQIGENYVSYPQLKGMRDEAVQAKINDDIVMSAGVTDHLLSLVTLGDSAWGLQVSYQVLFNRDGVFSVLLNAEGKMPSNRQGQRYTALTYDLQTGERLTLNQLFANVPDTLTKMLEKAEKSLEAELANGYNENCNLSPIPQTAFTLDEDGITFWYEAEQLQLLSGDSGALQFRYDELQNELIQSKDALPARLGLLAQPLTSQEMGRQIMESVKAGKLPHVPVSIGDKMTTIVERYHLSRTPDAFPGGRYFVLEAPAFRDILVISDAIQSGYDHSVVEGIQQKRGGLAGLLIGQAVQADWRSALGTPDESVPMSDSMAYDYSLSAGEYDIYHYGSYELRLYADENGVLTAIQLGKDFGG